VVCSTAADPDGVVIVGTTSRGGCPGAHADIVNAAEAPSAAVLNRSIEDVCMRCCMMAIRRVA